MSDDDVIGVLTREVKTRRESVDAFRKGGREDLVAKEEAEIAILAEYLPQALGEDELNAMVAQAIVETGATSARDLGKVMGWLSPRTRGRADGKVVSGLVAQALAQSDLAAHGAAGSRRPPPPPRPIRQPASQFTSRDAGRLIPPSLLAAAMSLILGLDIPAAQTALEVQAGPDERQAPHRGYVSEILTEWAAPRVPPSVPA
jgi:uncharacterized protein YqeY